MMKSFFKKLAFVMALAMVVSLAAPAAQASAAEKKEFTYAYQDGGKVTKLYMNAGETVDLKFVGVPDYKDYELNWVCLDEGDIATVNQKGEITALADGKTSVKLQIKGSNYTSDPIEVVVGEAAPVVKLGTTKDDTFTEKTLEVGETVDLAFYGVPNYSKTNYNVVWAASYDGETAIVEVDNGGNVTAKAEGTATVTATIVNNFTGAVSEVEAVKFTVVPAAPVEEPTATPVPGEGEGEVADSTPTPEATPTPAPETFVASPKSDKVITLTFDNKELTKADLEGKLGFYYYIGTNYPVDVDALIKSIGNVENGVVDVELHTTINDGLKYGFTYGAEEAEFDAVIGDVVSIGFTYKNAYVGNYTTLNPVLLNAAGVDITTSALRKNGSYVYFVEATPAQNGEYWVSDNTIWFNEVCTAEVKVQYFGGSDENGNEIVGPSAVLPVMSQPKPVYGVPQTGEYTYDIADALDFSKVNHKLAVGDSGKYLYLQVKDSENKDINSTDNTRGTWRFESTNVAVLYVKADDGLLMPNTSGDATVLVYYKPTETNVETLVSAVPVHVSAARAVASVELDKYNATISTVSGYNSVTFKVTLKDALGDNRTVSDKAVVKCTTNVTNVSAKPSVDGWYNCSECTIWSNTKGELYIPVVGYKENIPSTSQTGVQTYNYTVTVNGITKTFSVTIKNPQTDNGNIVASGYKLSLNENDVKDIKTTTNPSFTLRANFEKLSNGVAVGTQNLLGAKPSDPTKAVMNGFYYTITKNGADITDKAYFSSYHVWDEETDSWKYDENGNPVFATDYTVVNVRLSGTKWVSDVASGSSIRVVNKEQGTGTYRVIVYQAIGSTGAATPSAFKTVTSATVTVSDSQASAAYAGKIKANVAVGTSLEDIAMNCFKFTVGDKTYDDPSDYANGAAYVKVDANTVTNGNICYINSVTLYHKTGNYYDVEANGGVYVEYKINVGDYVTLQ